MDIIFELIIKNLIVNFFGLYSRYYFFKLIGNSKDIKYLSGDKTKYDSNDIVQQPIYNVIIGLVVFAGISILIAYLVYGVIS